MNWSNTDLRYISKVVVKTSDFNSLTLTAENLGSGLLCCYKGKTYLLTAGHCAQNWEEGNFTVEQMESNKYGEPKFRTLRLGKKCFLEFNKETGKDYAIFEIENPDNGFLNESRIAFADPNEADDTESFYAYGYPFLHREGFALNANFIYPNSWKLDVGNNTQKTFHELVEGFSGAPIVSSGTSNTFKLFAIQKKTFDNTGSLNSVLSTFSTYYRDMLESLSNKQQELTYTPVQIDDNPDYIERKVELWNASILSSFVDVDNVRYTLYDYVTEQVPTVQSFRFLLVAPAQSGKSYELRHLAYLLVKENYAVSYLEGKNLTTEALDLLPGQESIDNHPTAIIIDALDESAIGTDTLIKYLNDYSLENPTVKILVSCRQNYKTDNALNGFTALYLSDISYSEAANIIDIRIEDKQKTNALKEYIAQHEVREFSTNLFCLLQLIEITKQNGTLPDSRSELYRMFVGEPDKGIDAETTSNKYRRVLQSCATLMLMTGSQSLRRDEVMLVIGEDESLTIDKLPRNILMHTYDDNLTFVNNAIKEFLAAEALVPLSLDAVQSLVCFRNTTQINPQWYNVLTLWLQQRSKQQPLETKVIDWISTVSKDLLLQCDASSIDLSTRFVLVQSILEDHKKKRTIFSAIYTDDYKRLYKFGESLELISYIADQLSDINDNYVYNILSLTPYIDYEKLHQDSLELYSRIVDVMFNVIEQFGHTENSGACYYFMYMNKHFYENEGYVERLFSIIKDWHNQDAVNSMAAVCSRGDCADNYAEWFITNEPYMRSSGYSIIHKSPLYYVLGKVHNYKPLYHVLSHILTQDVLRYENDAEDYVKMLRSLLSTAYLYRTDSELMEVIKRSFHVLFIEHPYAITPSVSTKILSEFKSFFAIACGDDKSIQDSIKSAEEFGRFSPDQIEEMRLQRQKSFEEMCIYESFASKIHKVADTQIQNCNDTTTYVIKAGYGSDTYVLNFILNNGGLHSFDSKRLHTAIENQEVYFNFRMCELVSALLQKNRGIEVKNEQIQETVHTATKILEETAKRVTAYETYLQSQAIKLLLLGYVKLSEEVLFALLPNFANESITVPDAIVDDGNETTSLNLLQFAIKCIGIDAVTQQLIQWIKAGDKISEPQFLMFIDYLANNNLDYHIDIVFDASLHHSNPAIIELLTEKFLYIPPLKAKLREQYENLSENSKITLLTDLLDNEEDKAWSVAALEALFPSLSNFNKQRATALMLKNGSVFMLKYVDEHREETFKSSFGYILSYDDPTCIDILLSLYPYVFQSEDIMHLCSGSIMTSIGNIARQSPDLLDKASAGVKRISDDLQMPILLNQIDVFQMLYYQHNANVPSFSEALQNINTFFKYK